MPRKKKVQKRQIKPDIVYGSVEVAKLINKIMKDGKKNLAYDLVYSAFEIIKQKTGKDPFEVFKKALENSSPEWELRSRRVGGATYQIPIACLPERKLRLGLKFIVDSARERTDKMGMAGRIASEIIEASEGKGGAVKKKEELHKLAETNKTFAHYKW